jgi:hypothetical protein
VALGDDGRKDEADRTRLDANGGIGRKERFILHRGHRLIINREDYGSSTEKSCC